MINWLKSLLGIKMIEDNLITLQGELDSLRALVESAVPRQDSDAILAKGQVFIKDYDATAKLNVNDVALVGNVITFRFGAKNLAGNNGNIFFVPPPEIAGRIQLAGWQNIMVGSCQFENGTGADFTIGTVELRNAPDGRSAYVFKFRRTGQPGDDGKARLLSNRDDSVDWPYNLQYGLLLEACAVLT